MDERFCEDCEHVSRETRDKPPHTQRCMAWPTTKGYGYVSRDYWDAGQPYRRCAEINTDGCCPLWERRRDGQMELDT